MRQSISVNEIAMISESQYLICAATGTVQASSTCFSCLRILRILEKISSNHSNVTNFMNTLINKEELQELWNVDTFNDFDTCSIIF